jgi:hypothetical protein
LILKLRKVSVEEVAAAFIQHYYTSLGTNTAALAGLYVRNAFHVFDNIFYCGCYGNSQKLPMSQVGAVCGVKDVQVGILNALA